MSQNMYFNQQYVVNQSGVPAYTTPWFRALDWHRVSFTVSWAGFAATAGVLSFEGTDFPADDVVNIPPAGLIVPLTITTFHGTFPNVAATAGRALVILENPPGWVRGRYTPSGGGTVNQFQWLVAAYSQ